MNKTNIMVEFSVIANEFDISAFTKKIQIEPMEFYNKGDQINGKSHYRIETCWSIHTEYTESLDMNEEIIKIIKILEDKTALLKKFKSINNVEYIICVVIIINNNQTPAMYVDKEIIKFLSEIDARLDIDLYIN